MNVRISGALASAAFVVVWLLGSAQSLAQNAYITNVVLEHRVGDRHGDQYRDRHDPGRRPPPSGVAVSPDGSKVYVTNVGTNTVSVIDTATNAVTATITGRTIPSAWR